MSQWAGNVVRVNLQRFLQRFQLSPTIRHVHGAYTPRARMRDLSSRHILQFMESDMTHRYRKFKRSWGSYYAFDNVTGNSVTLKTRDRNEADQKVHAMNETERRPAITLGLARVYMNAADPKLGTRTWQEVMEHIVAKKADETRRRWEVAIKDKNFDCIRNLAVAETRPEHFDRALADGKVAGTVGCRGDGEAARLRGT